MGELNHVNKQKYDLTPTPAVWDNIARDEPDRIVVSIPIGNNVKDGYTDVTAKTLANAINRAAWFLETQLGKSESFETIAYLGPSDLRYPIIMSAAAKAGYKAFWTSPRNSLEGHIRLMQASGCTVFLTPSVIPAGIGQVIETLKMRHIVVPEQVDWLDNTEIVKEYKFEKTYDQVRLDPFTVVHTSGSTGEFSKFVTNLDILTMSPGFPKPAIIPYGIMSLAEAFLKGPREEGGGQRMSHYFREHPGRLLTAFPMFHGAGLFLFHHFIQFLGQIAVLPPPRPATAELMDEIICSGLVTSAFIPPSTINDLSTTLDFLDNLKRLKLLIYAGAHLPAEIGRKLLSKTRVISIYGQTETGWVDQLLVDREDFAYIRLGSLSNIEFRHQTDNLYEPVMVKKEGLEVFQGGMMLTLDSREVHMRDLFSKHPDPAKSDLFIFSGRSDSIIVFENGEKINPSSLEMAVGVHQEVRSAMVIGEGRFQAALLVEPIAEISNPVGTKALLQTLWPTIEAANNEYPAHGRIHKGFVLFTQPGKPFARTAKESIARKQTLDLYEQEIEAIYAAADTRARNNSFKLDISLPGEQLTEQLRAIIRETTKIDVANVHDDLYMLGMDSLQTIHLSRSLGGALPDSNGSLSTIPPSFIYSHPTLHQLGTALLNCGNPTTKDLGTGLRTQQVEAVLAKYSLGLPQQRPAQPVQSKSIILTGSTGNFGSYLLDVLYADTNVSHIYCLNRSLNASDRQITGNTSRGLLSSFDPSRVTFVLCDFSKPRLNLDIGMYDHLLDNVTHIIHNAWTVDFNLSLPTLAKTNIAGVRSLIDLALATINKTEFFFVSSLGAVTNWVDSGYQGPVPEKIITDPAVPEPLGYGESKHIAERLLATAHSKSGLKVCCLRVGQIAGPIDTDKGSWNKAEWLPSLLAISRDIDVVPSSLGAQEVVSWLPSNVLANVVVDLVNHGISGEEPLVYHLVNPNTTTWGELYSVVQNFFKEAGREVKAVGYEDWIREVYQTAHGSSNSTAIKLRDFFHSMRSIPEEKRLHLSTEKTIAVSSRLRDCGPVTGRWLKLWLKQLGI